MRAWTASAPPLRARTGPTSATARRSDQMMPGPVGAPPASVVTKVWRAPQQATTSMSAMALPSMPAAALAAAAAARTDSHHEAGSCSAQPISGRSVTRAARPRARSPFGPHSPTLVNDVPRSRVRITGGAGSPAVHDVPNPRRHLGRVLVLDDGPAHGQTGAATGHHVGRLGHQALVVVPPRAAQEEDRTTDRGNHPTGGFHPWLRPAAGRVRAP